MKCEFNKYLRCLILLAICMLPIGKGVCATADSITTKIKAVVKFQPVKKSFNYTDTTIIKCYFNTNQNDSVSRETLRQKISFLDSFHQYKNDILALISFALLIVATMALLIIRQQTSCINKEKKENCENIVMQLIIILAIVFICFISNSSWAYLALVVLCILYLSQYKKGLLQNFSIIAAALHGKLEIDPSTQKDKYDKDRKEVMEEETKEQEKTQEQNKRNVARVLTKRNEVKLINNRIQEYAKIEQLALQYLGQQYPNLQSNVTIRLGSHERAVLDGFIQNDNSNIVIEIKYNRSVIREYQLEHLFRTAEYISRQTGNPTFVLLFIVTDDEETKKSLISKYNNLLPNNGILSVKVFTKREITKPMDTIMK